MVAVFLVGLAGPALAQGDGTGMKSLMPTNFGIKQCLQTPQVVAVIRAYMPAKKSKLMHFDPSQMSRNVTYKPPAKNGDENTGDDISSPGTYVADIGNPKTPNPYHIDLTSLPLAKLNAANKPYPYVELRFILLDGTNYTFGNLTDSNGKPITGIAAGEVTSGVGLCDASIVLHKSDGKYPPNDVAVVYAPLSSTGSPKPGGYSIILLPNSATDTPIFIDPKMQNNGAN